MKFQTVQQFQTTVPTPHISLPTFLVGWGGPTVEDGISVSGHGVATTSDMISSELNSSFGSGSDYHSYLLDARSAVRYAFQIGSSFEYYSYLKYYSLNRNISKVKTIFCRRRFEATQCWQYDYDGIHPPPNSTVPSNSPLAIEHEDAYLSTNIVGSNSIEDVTESKVYRSKGSRLGLDGKEFSSTFGLTAEETREFWDMILPEETGIGM